MWIIRLSGTNSQWWNNDHGWCDDISLATIFNGKAHGHPPTVTLPIGQDVHWQRIFHEDHRVNELIFAVNDLMANIYDSGGHIDRDTGKEHDDSERVSAALDAFALEVQSG
jgi:hypothetical protein